MLCKSGKGSCSTEGRVSDILKETKGSANQNDFHNIKNGSMSFNLLSGPIELKKKYEHNHRS